MPRVIATNELIEDGMSGLPYMSSTSDDWCRESLLYRTFEQLANLRSGKYVYILGYVGDKKAGMDSPVVQEYQQKLLDMMNRKLKEFAGTYDYGGEPEAKMVTLKNGNHYILVGPFDPEVVSTMRWVSTIPIQQYVKDIISAYTYAHKLNDSATAYTRSIYQDKLNKMEYVGALRTTDVEKSINGSHDLTSQRVQDALHLLTKYYDLPLGAFGYKRFSGAISWHTRATQYEERKALEKARKEALEKAKKDQKATTNLNTHTPYSFVYDPAADAYHRIEVNE